MPYSFDISLALSTQIGSHGGVSRKALSLRTADFSEIHLEFQNAIEQGLLPMCNAIDDELLQQLSQGLSSFEGQIAFLGEASVLSSLRAHSKDLPILWLDSPSPDIVQHVDKSAESIMLVVLDGPLWVRDVAAQLSSVVEIMWVLSGDGTPYDGWKLENADHFVVDGIADSRFAPFSPIGLALLCWQGVALENIKDTLARVQQRCNREGVFQNPSFLFASLLAAFEREGLSMRLALVFPDSDWLDWGAWAAGVWSAITSQVVDNQGRRQRFGAESSVLLLTDENRIQQLITSPKEQLTILFAPERPTTSQVTNFTKDMWDLQNMLLDAFTELLIRDGRPLCQMIVDRNDCLHRLEMSYGWVYAALAFGAFRADDPLEMSGSDKWRNLIAEFAAKSQFEEE